MPPYALYDDCTNDVVHHAMDCLVTLVLIFVCSNAVHRLIDILDEWCDAEFRKRVAKHVRSAFKHLKCTMDKNNKFVFFFDDEDDGVTSDDEDEDEDEDDDEDDGVTSDEGDDETGAQDESEGAALQKSESADVVKEDQNE